MVLVDWGFYVPSVCFGIFFIAVADHSCYAKAEGSAQQGTGPVPLVESLPRFDSTDADHLIKSKLQALAPGPDNEGRSAR